MTGLLSWQMKSPIQEAKSGPLLSIRTTPSGDGNAVTAVVYRMLGTLSEGVSRSTFYRWKRRLDDGIPETTESDSAASADDDLDASLFLPVSVTSSRVEIELPNGGVVRLPSDLGKDILVAMIRVAGSLRPWKAPEA